MRPAPTVMCFEGPGSSFLLTHTVKSRFLFSQTRTVSASDMSLHPLYDVEVTCTHVGALSPAQAVNVVVVVGSPMYPSTSTIFFFFHERSDR